MAGSARGEPDLTSAYRRTGLTAREVWFRHLALGGNADEVSVEAQLYGLLTLPSGEYNVLAQAVNEALDDLPRSGHGPDVAYRRLMSDDEDRRR
ncbi:MAG: phosphatase [Frankiales bacterium]|nr:phosphatase [Frankiales bacterium]